MQLENKTQRSWNILVRDVSSHLVVIFISLDVNNTLKHTQNFHFQQVYSDFLVFSGVTKVSSAFVQILTLIIWFDRKII